MHTFTVQNDGFFELTEPRTKEETVAAKTLANVLSQVVEARAEYDTRLLAQQLGTNYRSLMYWLRGDRPIPAELLPKVCMLLKNFEALDVLESQAGRVAFKIPDPQETSEKEFLVISKLMKDVGSALESIANTLADGIVEESELNATVPKLEAVIRECASVKYLLETLCKERRKKAKK
jgi:regulatory protein CII